MSVRRPAPLVARHEALAVGALADRLPGSTRLSEVLAAGAKHLAKHKTVDTEAPGKRPLDEDVGLRQSISRPIIAQRVKRLNEMVAAYDAAANAGASPATLQLLMHQILAHVQGIADRALTVADMEILRRMGAYFVLSWIWQNGVGVGATDAQRMATIQQQKDNAELLLSEALHRDPDDADNFNVNLHKGVAVLGLADGPVMTIAKRDEKAFEERYKAEKRQKVDDEREAKRKKQKTQEVSPELEEQVEAAQDAQGLQAGEIVPGQDEEQSKNQEAEAQQEAQGDNLGGGLGDDIGYGEASEPSDDEEDDFEGNPLAQQVDQTRKK